MANESNGNGSLVAIVTKYGVGSAIGLYLTWQMAQHIPSMDTKLDKVQANQEGIISTMSMVKMDHEVIKSDLQNLKDNMVYGIRQICLNGAKNDQAVSNCNRIQVE